MKMLRPLMFKGSTNNAPNEECRGGEADQQLYYQVKKSQTLTSKSVPPCIQPHASPFPLCCRCRIYFHGVVNLYRYLPSSCLSTTPSDRVGTPSLQQTSLSTASLKKEACMLFLKHRSLVMHAQTLKRWIYQRSHPT